MTRLCIKETIVIAVYDIACRLLRSTNDMELFKPGKTLKHYDDVIMGAMASQITSRTIGYSTVYSGANQRKHQSSASRAFVRGIHRWPVNSPHKWPVARKMFPFDDVIMWNSTAVRTKFTESSDPIFTYDPQHLYNAYEIHKIFAVFFSDLMTWKLNFKPHYS